MEQLYKGSDGVRVRVFGFNEAVAALSAAPAPTPAPAPPGPTALPALIPGAMIALTPVNDVTYLGTVVDTGGIDLTSASVVGNEFKIVLANPGGAAATVSLKLGPTYTSVVAIPVGTLAVVMSFTVASAGLLTAVVQFTPLV